MGVCVMFQRIAYCVFVVASAISAATASAEGMSRQSGQTALLQAPAQPAPSSSPAAKAPTPADEEAKKRSLISDIAAIATVIAASRAAYLAMGKPYGCPDHVAANGSRCGLRSAHTKPGGFKPLCFPTDVSPAIIAAWRETGSVPPL
jgi:hypothetical protein